MHNTSKGSTQPKHPTTKPDIVNFKLDQQNNNNNNMTALVLKPNMYAYAR